MLAGRGTRKQARSLGLGSELGDRHGAQSEGREDRNRRHRASHLLEEDAELDQPHAAAAVCLGNADTEQPGAREFRPQPPIDPLRVRLDLHQPLCAAVVGEHASGEVAQRVLVGAVGEVHGEPSLAVSGAAAAC